jgi:hypothetical protein
MTDESGGPGSRPDTERNSPRLVVGMTPESFVPDAQVLREICARAFCCERTARRAYKEPSDVRPGSLARITKAALELGIDPPGPSAGLKVLKDFPGSC